jgi:hypothetical protein
MGTLHVEQTEKNGYPDYGNIDLFYGDEYVHYL